jgi:hypothetical protein
LKKADDMVSVLHYQPVLRLIPTEDLKTDLLVKRPRGFKILDIQAD